MNGHDHFPGHGGSGGFGGFGEFGGHRGDAGNATYQFTLSNGSVTAVSVTRGDGAAHDVPIGPTTTFSTAADGSITETVVQGNAIDTIHFVAGTTAGTYTMASIDTTFIQAGTSTTHLDVEPGDRAQFTIDASGAVTAVQQVKFDGATSAVTVKDGVTYSQLAAGYVLETHTNGTKSSYEVYHDGNGDGIYTEVAHGSGTTVDLVGLKAQMTAAIDAVL